MYGLEAIRLGNGWEISIVGLSIVFTALTFLCVFIGQIHKLLKLWENRNDIKAFLKKGKNVNEEIVKFTKAQKIAAKQFFLLVERMNSPFSLTRLLMLAELAGIRNPHQNLYMLVKSGIIIPDGNGFYLWDNDRFVFILSRK